MSYTFAGILVFYLRHKEEPTLFSTLKLLFHSVNHFRDNAATLQKSYSLLEYLLFTIKVCVQLLIKHAETLSAFKTPPNLRMPTKVVVRSDLFVIFYNLINQIRQKFSRMKIQKPQIHLHLTISIKGSACLHHCNKWLVVFFKICYSSHIAAGLSKANYF